MRWPFLALLGLGIAIAAEANSQTNTSDPRIQVEYYVPNQPVAVQTVPGTGLVIILAQGERIQAIRLSDPTTYQVNVAAAGDSLFLRQVRPLSHATMFVETDQRRYDFSLMAGSDLTGPYLVHFNYAAPSPNSDPSPLILPQDMSQLTSYRLTGNKALRPQSIGDDGARTYIQWGQDQSVPAVFAIDRLGREEMVDGYMRNGIFTIDRVHDRLVFRIDQAAMIAKRLSKRTKTP